MQTLAVAERIAVAGGETLRREVPEATVAVTAIGEGHATIAVPVKDGRIEWTAPQGSWQVVIVAHRFETSPTRSETNLKLATEPRPNTNNVQAKDQSQSLEDYLDPGATRQFLAFTHEQYKKYLGEEFGRTILGFRGDEPDYSVSGLPWTQSFFDRFQQVKGYDLSLIHIFNYDRMRDANVLGTNEVLRLAFEGRAKEFNYVSTTFVFGWAVKSVLYETDFNKDMELLDFGYSQSKWVAEQVVADARSRGLSTRIFRPALVSPSVTGGGNNFDIAVRLVAFMVNHGIGVDALNQVSFVPADIVANNIVAISALSLIHI